MKKLSVLGGLALCGCQTMQLSPEGVAVRTITPVVAQSCRHVGIATSFQPVLVGGMSAAQVDIRNRVASLGGNAMVITAQYHSPGQNAHGNINAEAYKCNLPGDKPTINFDTKLRFGIMYDNLTVEERKEHERNSGVMIHDVQKDSRAWRANVLPGDVLIEINGKATDNTESTRSLLLEAPTDRDMVVKVIRKGQIRQITAPPLQ